MAAVSQTTFSNAFSWMKMYQFWLKFHWSMFLRIQLTIFQYWFRWWLCAEQATRHYLNQWCPRLPRHICVTQPQWVNTLSRGPNGCRFAHEMFQRMSSTENFRISIIQSPLLLRIKLRISQHSFWYRWINKTILTSPKKWCWMIKSRFARESACLTHRSFHRSTDHDLHIHHNFFCYTIRHNAESHRTEAFL